MKATIVAVFALTVTSVCARPHVVPREYYYVGGPRSWSDLEARRWRINWGKVGKFAKGALKVGVKLAPLLLLRSMDENELYARGFIDKEDLFIRDFDDYLEVRDLDEYLEARGFGDDYLEQRDLNFLELREEDDDDDRHHGHHPHHHHHHHDDDDRRHGHHHHDDDDDRRHGHHPHHHHHHEKGAGPRRMLRLPRHLEDLN